MYCTVLCDPNVKLQSEKLKEVFRTGRRKIILMEGDAKCRHLKVTCIGTLRQVFICMRPIFHTGKGGGSEPEKRLEG
jgi:hypothetical protein